MEPTENKQCPVPAGTLVIIGGKENKGADQTENRETPDSFTPLEILRKFVELTGRPDPVVELITSASGSGEESYQEYKALFGQLGVKQLGHIYHQQRQQVLDENIQERIARADAFFFSGGDQLQLTGLYGGSPFLTELKKRYIHERVIIGGTSAGAMALSTPMIYAGSQEVQELGGAIKITTGLEFLKDACIDTHFVHRGRFVRLAQVIATNPTCIGIGIEEDTAVIITNGLDASVIGSGVIIFIDGFDITASNIKDFTEKKPVSIRNLRVDILAHGDTFQIPQINPPHI